MHVALNKVGLRIVSMAFSRPRLLHIYQQITCQLNQPILLYVTTASRQQRSPVPGIGLQRCTKDHATWISELVPNAIITSPGVRWKSAGAGGAGQAFVVSSWWLLTFKYPQYRGHNYFIFPAITPVESLEAITACILSALLTDAGRTTWPSQPDSVNPKLYLYH